MNRVIQKFYLPEGLWYDFVTGKKFPGGHKYVSFFKDEDYPVFAKAGAIIPMANNKNLNDTTPPNDMEIHIFPGQSNSYKLYEDDGISKVSSIRRSRESGGTVPVIILYKVAVRAYTSVHGP